MAQRIIITCLALLVISSACRANNSPKSTIVFQDELVLTAPLEITDTQDSLPTITQTKLPQKTPTILTKTEKPTSTITATPSSLREPPAGIKYRTATGLYIKDGSGSTKLLFKHGENEYASLSADGSSVLLFSSSNQYIIDIETGRMILIWPMEEYNLCSFYWINRQPPVLLSVILPEFADPGYSCNRGSPVILSLDGEITIFDIEGTGYSHPDVSWDGEYIAYDLGGSPWIYDWQNGAKRFDVTSFGFPQMDKVAFSDPAWSPSGKKLAWTFWTYDTSEELAQSGIAIFNFETQTSTLLAPYDIINFEGSRPFIKWNSDETYISVYHFNLTMTDVWEMIAVDGSTTRTLDGNFIQWNPSGDLFTISKYINQGNRWDLYIESPNGSVSYPICCGTHDVHWSPDGKELLSRSRDNKYWIWDLETGTKVQINLPTDADVISWDVEQ